MRKALPLIFPLLAIALATVYFLQPQTGPSSIEAVIVSAPETITAPFSGTLSSIAAQDTVLQKGDILASFDDGDLTQAIRTNEKSVEVANAALPPNLAGLVAELVVLKPSSRELAELVEQAQAGEAHEQGEVMEASTRHIAVQNQMRALEIKERLTPAEKTRLIELQGEEARLARTLAAAKNNRELVNTERATLERNWRRKQSLEKALAALPRAQYDAVQQVMSLLAESDRLNAKHQALVIRSPGSGVVLLSLSNAGDAVKANQPLLLLGEKTTPLIIDAEFSLKETAELRTGAACEITWMDKPNWKSQGRITQVNGLRATIAAELPAILLARHSGEPLPETPAPGQKLIINLQ